MKRKFNTKNNLNSSKLLHNNLTEMESLVYQEFYSRHCSNAFRGFYADAEFATKNYIEANVNLIKLFGADDEANMLLLPQTSNFGVSLIAHGWASQKIMQNERMLIFSPKQNSQLITWQKVARKTSCDLEVYNDFECSEKIISLLQRGNLRLLVLPLYSDLCGA
jgi:selenocysteine lyase/cysteine desulfurase